MSNRVVARYRDGRVLKGTSLDAAGRRPMIHVRPPGGSPVEVAMKDLKALFFVRSLEGDPTHDEALEPDESDVRGRGSTPVRIVFEDGEVIVGLSISNPPKGDYFFIVPVDPRSNNQRILVNRGAVAEVEIVRG